MKYVESRYLHILILLNVGGVGWVRHFPVVRSVFLLAFKGIYNLLWWFKFKPEFLNKGAQNLVS